MISRVTAPAWLILLLWGAVAGCGNSSSSQPSQTFPDNPRTVFGGDRPVTLQVPTTYDPSHSAPLLVILHGYGANGMIQEQYLGFGPLVESQGVLIIAPDGTIDQMNRRFWNATPACCDLYHTGVDDVGYIRGLIADIRHDYNVDPRRIYVVGHSNGAFMAHRMACDDAEDIAAIMALAGATYENPADCKPSAPVSILDIHGDADALISYTGGRIADAYPGEAETTMHWQVYDSCSPDRIMDPQTLDLDRVLPGNETSVQHFGGCAADTDVELWTIHGGGHVPSLTGEFSSDVWTWLQAHPKS